MCDRALTFCKPCSLGSIAEQAEMRVHRDHRRRTVRLDLAAVQGHWRVSDVHTAETPSPVSYLARSLRAAYPKD